LKITLAIAPLVPQLRSQARQWTTSQDEADDIVLRALTLAIDDLPGSHVENVESWPISFLGVARDETAIESRSASASELPSAVNAARGHGCSFAYVGVRSLPRQR
jgi:hypothetical protein